MWLVAVGVLIQVLNLAGIGPIGEWTWRAYWWAMLSPFALSVIWWAWSDWSGLTQRNAMKKVDAKREARRQKALDALVTQSPKKYKR
jgi:small Trp-rich protein